MTKKLSNHPLEPQKWVACNETAFSSSGPLFYFDITVCLDPKCNAITFLSELYYTGEWGTALSASARNSLTNIATADDFVAQLDQTYETYGIPPEQQTAVPQTKQCLVPPEACTYGIVI